MCTASQADVLVPQGYGSILAQIRITFLKASQKQGIHKTKHELGMWQQVPMEWEAHSQVWRQTNCILPAALRFEGAGSTGDSVCTLVCRQLPQACFLSPFISS